MRRQVGHIGGRAGGGLEAAWLYRIKVAAMAGMFQCYNDLVFRAAKVQSSFPFVHCIMLIFFSNILLHNIDSFINI